MTDVTTKTGKPSIRRDSIYLIVIGLLVASNVYFLIDSRNQRKALAATQGQVSSLEEDRTVSKSQREALLERVDSLDNELEVQRGLSGQLDHLVDSLREVLQLKRAEIARNQKLSQEEIAALQRELENTKAAYLTMISDLKTRLGIVEAENVELKDSIVKAQQREEELTAKVKTGETMQANNDVTATGLTTKSGGKEKDTDIAKNVEKFKVCFSFVENRLAAPGNKTVIVRIIDPGGKTLMAQALGSGSFTTTDGSQLLFTTRADIPYDPNDPGRTRCITWTPPAEVVAGTYQFELYHEGHRIGKTSLELKKGIL